MIKQLSNDFFLFLFGVISFYCICSLIDVLFILYTINSNGVNA